MTTRVMARPDMADDAATAPNRRRWWVLALLGAAFFMTTLDGTSIMTALPALRGELGLGAETAAAVISVYGLAYGGLLVASGRAADRYGRRRLFLGGIVLRVVAAVICATATTGVVLIAGRALLGLSAAVIAPSALSQLMRWFPDGPERAKALGIWGALGGLGATSGLLLGGVVTELAGWSAVFLVNVPVGLAVLAVGSFLLHESRDERDRPPMNLPAALTVTTGLVLLVLAVVRAPEAGWSVGVLGLLGGSAAALAGFVLLERRSPRPMLPARLIRSRVRAGGNLAILLAGMAVEGMLLVLTAWTQQSLGLSALGFGGLASAMTVTSVAGASMAQRITTASGPRRAVIGGAVALTVSGALLALAVVSASLAVAVVALLVFGLGMSGVFVGGQIAALNDVPESTSGVAAGITDTCFALGNALGAAACGSVLVAVGSAPAFAVCGGFTLLAVAGATALLPRPAPAR